MDSEAGNSKDETELEECSFDDLFPELMPNDRNRVEPQDKPRSKDYQACMNMWCACLHRVIFDLEYMRKESPSADQVKQAMQCLDWISEVGKEHNIRSFEGMCVFIEKPELIQKVRDTYLNPIYFELVSQRASAVGLVFSW